MITKRRYVIPLGDGGLQAELDLFSGAWDGLQLAEVEFPTEAEANNFAPPEWFGEDVTFDGKYHNSWLSQHNREDASYPK